MVRQILCGHKSQRQQTTDKRRENTDGRKQSSKKTEVCAELVRRGQHIDPPEPFRVSGHIGRKGNPQGA